jgi:DNA-directed RNA polymerase specialized sigma subunit
MAAARSKCYQLFQLFYYQSRSMREIADELGYSSEANARQQKYKCLTRLRAHIDKLLDR